MKMFNTLHFFGYIGETVKEREIKVKKLKKKKNLIGMI